MPKGEATLGQYRILNTHLTSRVELLLRHKHCRPCENSEAREQLKLQPIRCGMAQLRSCNRDANK